MAVPGSVRGEVGIWFETRDDRHAVVDEAIEVEHLRLGDIEIDALVADRWSAVTLETDTDVLRHEFTRAWAESARTSGSGAMETIPVGVMMISPANWPEE